LRERLQRIGLANPTADRLQLLLHLTHLCQHPVNRLASTRDQLMNLRKMRSDLRAGLLIAP